MWAPSLQAGSLLPGHEQACGPSLEVQHPAASHPGRTGLQSVCGEAILAETGSPGAEQALRASVSPSPRCCGLEFRSTSCVPHAV